MDWGENSTGKGSNVEMSGQITVKIAGQVWKASAFLYYIKFSFLFLFSLAFTEFGSKKILVFPWVPIRGKGFFVYFPSLSVVLLLTVLLHQY